MTDYYDEAESREMDRASDAYDRRKDDESEAYFALNSTKTVAVATDYYWQPMDTCPRGVKVQFLGKGGVANYGIWNGKDDFYTHWAPLPKKP